MAGFAQQAQAFAKGQQGASRGVQQARQAALRAGAMHFGTGKPGSYSPTGSVLKIGGVLGKSPGGNAGFTAQQMPSSGTSAPFGSGGGSGSLGGQMKTTKSKSPIAKPGKGFGKGSNLNRLATVLAGQNQRGPANFNWNAQPPSSGNVGNRGRGGAGNGTTPGIGNHGTRPTIVPIRGKFVA